MVRATWAPTLLSLVLGACGGGADSKVEATPASVLVEPAAGPAEAELQAVDWPVADDCASTVRDVLGLDAAEARRLDARSSPLALAIVEQKGLEIAGELPLPLVAAPVAGAVPCLVVVGKAEALAANPDRVLHRRTIHSSYQTGTKRRRNPEREALEKALAAARREAGRDSNVIATGDPLVDLIGAVAGSVINGFDAVMAGRELAALEADLDRTPAFIEDPILTPYRYERSDVEAVRRFAVPVTLHDRAADATWRTVVTLTEEQRFAIVDGRHARDAEAVPADTAPRLTSTELALWRRTPPPLDTRALLIHLLAATQSDGPPVASLHDAIVPPATDRTAAREAGAASATPFDHPAAAAGRDLPGSSARPEPAAGPVTMEPLLDDLVRVGEAGLAGFYVGPEHVLAPIVALGRSSLVAVRYPDGMQAYGLVELRDSDLGVALVYLPRPARALPLAAGERQPPPTGEPGVPWGTDGHVFGVFVEDTSNGGRQWIESTRLARLIARLDRL